MSPQAWEGTEDNVPIRSSSNAALKYVRSLQRRQKRHAERAFVVEGDRAIGDGVQAGTLPTLLLLREGREESEPDWLRSLYGRVPTRIVEKRLFDDISDTASPQGTLAVFPFPALSGRLRRAPLYVVIDRVRDPGNLGTLLRAAVGAGVSAVLLSNETVDPYHPKAVRAGMGAHFRVPIKTLEQDTRVDLEASCSLRALAEADGLVPYDGLDWTQPATLILGSEAEGVTADVASLATTSVRIPLLGGLESLNVGVAGAVILFEAARQRRRGPARGARARSSPEPAQR